MVSSPALCRASSGRTEQPLPADTVAGGGKAEQSRLRLDASWVRGWFRAGFVPPCSSPFPKASPGRADLGFPGLCIPVVPLLQLSPSRWAGALRQLAAGAVWGRKPSQSRRRYTQRAAVGEPAAACETTFPPSAPLSRDGKALRRERQRRRGCLWAVCGVGPRLACSAPSEIAALLLGSAPLSCSLLGSFAALVISSPMLVLGLWMEALLRGRLQ